VTVDERMIEFNKLDNLWEENSQELQKNGEIMFKYKLMPIDNLSTVIESG